MKDINSRIDKEKGVIYLTEKERTAQLLKPILRGRDIKRYSYEWAGLWLINTHNGYISDSSLAPFSRFSKCEASALPQKVASRSTLAKSQKSSQDTRIAEDSASYCVTSQKIKIPPVDIEQYPTLKAYFDEVAKNVKQGKGKGFYNRDDKGITPYNLRNCAYITHFAKPKIVYSEIVREPQFYLDNGEFKFGEFYAEATAFILTCNTLCHKRNCHSESSICHSERSEESKEESLRDFSVVSLPQNDKNKACHSEQSEESLNDSKKDISGKSPQYDKMQASLEYLLGLLHSKLCTFAFKEFYTGGGLGENGYRYKKAFLEKLPIPKITQSQEAEFIAIVKQILESKNQNKDTKELESKLDSMVYALYGLSNEEIELISNVGGGHRIAFLLIAAIESKSLALVKLLCENYEVELKEAFRFCEGLKVPNVSKGEYEGKIIYPNMAKEFIAYLDTKGFFTNQKCFIINDKCKDKNRLLYLTACLNSKLNFYYFKQIGATLGASGYEMSKIFVEKLPVIETHKIDSKLLSKIEALAKEVLETKKQDSLSDTSELETRLDSLIYQIYDLSKEEIALIESEFNNKERERTEIIENLYHLFFNYQAKSYYTKRNCHTEYSLCHSERSEESKEESLRDFSVVSLPQNDKNKACHNEALAEVSKESHRDISAFSKPQHDKTQYQGKIIWAEMTNTPCFVYEDKGFYINQTCYFIPQDDMYLCAVLNSKLIYFYMKQIASSLGDGAFRWIKQFIEKLPVIEQNRENAQKIEIIKALASQVIKQKGQNTQELESQIDSLIYGLYELSQNEIELIESSFALLGGGDINLYLSAFLCLFAKQKQESFANKYCGKILYPCIMANGPCFVYEEKGFFAPAPANIITGKECDMKYLTGLLNSAFVYYLMRKFYMGGGIERELKTNNLLKIPIPRIVAHNQHLADSIIALVEEILQNKAKDKNFNSLESENEINKLVYKLYNLSDEEIELIDNK